MPRKRNASYAITPDRDAGLESLLASLKAEPDTS